DCSDVATVVRFHVQAHFFVLRGHGFTVHDRGDVLAGPRGVPVCTVAAGTVRAVGGRGRLVRGRRRRVLVFLPDLDRCVDPLRRVAAAHVVHHVDLSLYCGGQVRVLVGQHGRIG